MYNRVRLTDISVSAFTPAAGQKTYWDETLPAFGVRVGRKSKTFIVARDHGRRVTIGRYPDVSLREARKEAKRLLSLSSLPQAKTASPSMRDAVSLFLETRAQRNRAISKKEAERILHKHFLPELGDLPVAEVTTDQLNRIVDRLMKTPTMANCVFTAARTFFNWCVARRYLTQSPLAGLPLPNKPRTRDRVLTDDELVTIYRAASEMGYPFGTMIQLCIHTGMRRGELGALKWSYITPEYITLPGSVTKNGQQHILPNLVGGILETIPKTSVYLFPSDADTPYSAWSKNKIKLDRLCGRSDWVIHDLRRTLSTKMAEWRIAPPHVIERILNHITGSMTPLARIYNRWNYLAEMKDALEGYEKRLALLLSQPAPAKDELPSSSETA